MAKRNAKKKKSRPSKTPKHPIKRRRKAVIRCCLVVISLTVTYAVLELVFPRLLPLLPLKTHWDLDEGIRVLAQYSKEGTIPEQYVTLVGDSYAVGLGDWFLDVNTSGRPAFHSAHIIHARTGRDVISFGRTDLGSLHGLVAAPISQYEFINASSRFHMEPPRFILIYFYEGNDLHDNHGNLEGGYESWQAGGSIRDPERFRTFLQERVHEGTRLSQRARNLTFRDELFLATFAVRRVGTLLEGRSHLAQANQESRDRSAGSVNRVLIGGRHVAIPDRLQSPALDLSDDEVRFGVYVFEQALDYLQEYFPESSIGIVYIPSPLASYRIVSPKVSIQVYKGHTSLCDSASVRARSDAIVDLIQRVARDQDVHFADARPHVWNASADELVHGPLDWKHFNKRGYTALSEAAIELITVMNPPE